MMKRLKIQKSLNTSKVPHRKKAENEAEILYKGVMDEKVTEFEEHQIQIEEAQWLLDKNTV